MCPSLKSSLMVMILPGMICCMAGFLVSLLVRLFATKIATPPSRSLSGCKGVIYFVSFSEVVPHGIPLVFGTVCFLFPGSVILALPAMSARFLVFLRLLVQSLVQRPFALHEATDSYFLHHLKEYW